MNSLVFLWMFRIVLLLSLIYACYFQYTKINNSKVIYITICLASIISLILTILDMHNFEISDYKQWTPCDDKDRIAWRRSIAIGFFCFLLVNYIYPQDTLKNVVLYILFVFILYFYFNWDQFHRYRNLCKDP